MSQQKKDKEFKNASNFGKGPCFKHFGAKINVAVMVSGSGGNLQALIDHQNAGKMPHANLALVLSSSANAFALQRAKKAGIFSVVVNAQNDEALLAILMAHNIKLVVLAGYLPIISKIFLANYSGSIINIHPSLIPSFCGKGYYGIHVHKAALARGVHITGATVHLVNGEIDGGDILLQKAVAVLPNDSPQSLQKRVMEKAEWLILPKAVEIMCGKILG